MNITNLLLIVSFTAGLIPAVLLCVLYGFKVEWSKTPTGRALFYLFLVVAATYATSVLVLAFPVFFTGAGGVWVRFTIRMVLAAVLWNLLRMFLKAQRSRKHLDE